MCLQSAMIHSLGIIGFWNSPHCFWKGLGRVIFLKVIPSTHHNYS